MKIRFAIARSGAVTETAWNPRGGAAIELAPEALGVLIRGLADIATNAWKAREKMLDEKGEPREETKRSYRHVDAVLRRLQDMEIRIVSHDHEIFDYGMPLKVIATQPTPGLARDTIIETLRPTVYWRQEMLQMGEVIVGTPQDPMQGET